MRIAGLAPVNEIQGLENIDVTSIVNGHMAYRSAMPRLLREVGWEVESDEFTEIEDPDPENHEKRQRELIREIDEARKEAETKPEKRRFGFFKRGKLAEKKRWETYDDSMREGDHNGEGNADGVGNVLFDIEAIKAELASEQIEVRQLESTLPPMKINLNGAAPTPEEREQSPDSNLRDTKSYDGSLPSRPSPIANSSEASLSNGHASNPFNRGYDSYDEHRNSENIAPQGKTQAIDPQPSPSPGQSFHSATNSPGLVPIPPLQEKPPQPPRPELAHSMTMPTGTSGASLEHNAWLDEEDEESGKEKEITMTFA